MTNLTIKDIKQLDEINIQINELHHKKEDLLKEEKKTCLEALKGLEWCKDFRARLYVDTMHGAGSHKYKLYLYGKFPIEPPEQCTHIFRTDKDYPDDIVLYKDGYCGWHNSPYVGTNDPKTLIILLLRLNLKR